MNKEEWIQKLLTYKDGRFATDKHFVFYALNYLARHKNQGNGAFFIDGFHKNGPKDLADLKQQIETGDYDWINKITYFSKVNHWLYFVLETSMV